MSNEQQQLVLECANLSKSFSEGKLHVDVLHNVNLKIAVGEMVAIIGPSGSGKSTLLHVLGGLDKPNMGSIKINGTEITQLSERERCHIRNRYLGFVYQFHHLLPEFTALENVCMPLLIRGNKPAMAIKLARAILDKVGLSKREEHRTSELSGGERQRVAIARALVTNPKCVLADEPTGNLDYKTAEQIHELITHLNQEYKTAFVIVTHDLHIARRMQRIMSIQDGILQQEEDMRHV